VGFTKPSDVPWWHRAYDRTQVGWTALTGSTVIVNSPYHVASGHLFVGESDIGAVTFKGDALQLQANGATQTKTRVGVGRKASIIGVWTLEHYSGARAYERYRADGTVEFRLPLSAYPGCYTVDAGSLAFTQPQASSSPSSSSARPWCFTWARRTTYTIGASAGIRRRTSLRRSGEAAEQGDEADKA